MTIRLQVSLRDVYGETKIYPVNEAAKYLASIAGTKTITQANIYRALQIGCEVEVVGPVNAVYGAADRWPSPQSFQLAR